MDICVCTPATSYTENKEFDVDRHYLYHFPFTRNESGHSRLTDNIVEINKMQFDTYYNCNSTGYHYFAMRNSVNTGKLFQKSVPY